MLDGDIDPEALSEAFNIVAKRQLSAQIREWIIYTAPKEVHDMLQEYEKIKKNKESDGIEIDERTRDA